MSSNYQLVKTSEKDLTQHFLKFYNHVRNEWKKLISILKENKTISDENYKMFKRMENKSNHMQADILDESIWSISRNQPVANHLRFVISVIYSISDLERMADYVINCVNIIRQNKLTSLAIGIILNAFKLSYICMEKIFKLLETKEKIKVDPIYAYHQANIVMNYYRIEYKEILKDLSEIIYDKNTPQQIETILSSVSIIVKYAERNVDHAVNILENFIYVRESNFFFNKHLTQSLDFDDINTSEVYTKKTKSKKQK